MMRRPLTSVRLADLQNMAHMAHSFKGGIALPGGLSTFCLSGQLHIEGLGPITCATPARIRQVCVSQLL